jgi:hypothetical protein
MTWPRCLRTRQKTRRKARRRCVIRGLCADAQGRCVDRHSRHRPVLTKPAGEGTGLGLSISHDIIVKQHNGTLEVDTQACAFTEFRIVLPRGAAPVAQSGGNGERAGHALFGGSSRLQFDKYLSMTCDCRKLIINAVGVCHVAVTNSYATQCHRVA